MKPIPNFDGYFADEFGNIYSIRPRNGKGKLAEIPRFMKPFKNKLGYMFVGLHQNKIKFHRSIHRLVLETFVSKCPPNMETAHNDGNKLDNNLDNLRWDTPKNNSADRVKHGTYQIGEKGSYHKLNEFQARIIIRLWQDKDRKRGIGTYLAKLWNVDKTTVSCIAKNKTWTYLPR